MLDPFLSVLSCYLLHHRLRALLGHLSLLPSYRILCLAGFGLSGLSGFLAVVCLDQVGVDVRENTYLTLRRGVRPRDVDDGWRVTHRTPPVAVACAALRQAAEVARCPPACNSASLLSYAVPTAGRQ